MLAGAVAVAITGAAFGVRARVAGGDELPSRRSVAMRTGALARVPIERAITPPLPLAPRFGAEVAGAPTLAWHLPEDDDGARVEICPTNDFDDATTRVVDVHGDRVTMPSPWPAWASGTGGCADWRATRSATARRRRG